jgi:hypothetical protein
MLIQLITQSRSVNGKVAEVQMVLESLPESDMLISGKKVAAPLPLLTQRHRGGLSQPNVTSGLLRAMIRLLPLGSVHRVGRQPIRDAHSKTLERRTIRSRPPFLFQRHQIPRVL